tara:strand:+ start:516 stop:734 length:219 start_codon:yes stop_codon:yes gene_type:complete
LGHPKSALIASGKKPYRQETGKQNKDPSKCISAIGITNFETKRSTDLVDFSLVPWRLELNQSISKGQPTVWE